METLRELNDINKLNKIKTILEFQNAEANELLEREVVINEAHDEERLNSILNDVFRRMDEARDAVANANRTKDKEEKRALMSASMSQLNRTRSLLDQVIKKWFPADGTPDASAQRSQQIGHILTPKQAADALGVHTSKIQNYLSSGKLRAVNDNGQWGVRGEDVQALMDMQNK